MKQTKITKPRFGDARDAYIKDPANTKYPCTSANSLSTMPRRPR